MALVLNQKLLRNLVDVQLGGKLRSGWGLRALGDPLIRTLFSQVSNIPLIPLFIYNATRRVSYSKPGR
jgi:hypothetical protein